MDLIGWLIILTCWKKTVMLSLALHVLSWSVHVSCVNLSLIWVKLNFMLTEKQEA